MPVRHLALITLSGMANFTVIVSSKADGHFKLADYIILSAKQHNGLPISKQCSFFVQVGG